MAELQQGKVKVLYADKLEVRLELIVAAVVSKVEILQQQSKN